MSNDLEARITKLEAEVKRLGELVGKFTIGDVDGDVTISINGTVQGMTVSAGDVGADMSVGIQTAQGVTIKSGDVGADMSVAMENGNMVVNTGDVGGDLDSGNG